jgi:hypothetical protein
VPLPAAAPLSLFTLAAVPTPARICQVAGPDLRRTEELAETRPGAGVVWRRVPAPDARLHLPAAGEDEEGLRGLASPPVRRGSACSQRSQRGALAARCTEAPGGGGGAGGGGGGTGQWLGRETALGRAKKPHLVHARAWAVRPGAEYVRR